MKTFRNWSKLAVIGLVAAGFLWGPVTADERKIIVRRQGVVRSYEVNSNQPVNVLTNRYMAAGLVETMADSIAKIGSLGGSAVLMGPNTIVDVAKFDPDSPSSEAILKQGVARFKVAKRPRDKFEVRTNSAVLAARGTDFLVQVADSYAGLPHTASLVSDGDLMAQGGMFTLMKVFSGFVEVRDTQGNLFGTLGRGDTLVATGGAPQFKYNDPDFRFQGDVPEPLMTPDPNYQERVVSTYYLSNIGPMGFYNEYLDNYIYDVTGGPLLIAPGVETNGSLLLEILLPGASSSPGTGPSSGGSSGGFSPFGRGR